GKDSRRSQRGERRNRNIVQELLESRREPLGAHVEPTDAGKVGDDRGSHNERHHGERSSLAVGTRRDESTGSRTPAAAPARMATSTELLAPNNGRKPTESPAAVTAIATPRRLRTN